MPSNGSRWAIYPPGTKHAADAEQLGELKIRSVTSTGATAVVVEERDTIVPGACAIDTVHDDAEARMSVYIAPALRPGLEALIYSARGENTREARRKTGPRDEWLTIERSFCLKSE